MVLFDQVIEISQGSDLRIFTYVSSTHHDCPAGVAKRFQRLTNSGE
jgi:hypothetical protein